MLIATRCWPLPVKRPPDLGEKLKQSAAARQFYRSAIDMDLSDQQWEAMLRRLKAEKER